MGSILEISFSYDFTIKQIENTLKYIDLNLKI